MIPHPIAPLKDLTVLVTRPADQAAKLCGLIAAKGGMAVSFPALAIEPLTATPAAQSFDWVIFTSVNSVIHGLGRVRLDERTRIAAIGKATAAALAVSEVRADATPEQSANSETLLAHPAFADLAGRNVLIVKGVGGREVLGEGLRSRGAVVSTLDVYRRARPNVAPEHVDKLETQWLRDGIEVVTLTSVDVLDNLLALLGSDGRDLLIRTPFVAASQRIADAARQRGLRADCIVSRGADDESLVGAIAAWYARAR